MAATVMGAPAALALKSMAAVLLPVASVTVLTFMADSALPEVVSNTSAVDAPLVFKPKLIAEVVILLFELRVRLLPEPKVRVPE